jgi:uncharacterized damage-inducible protein DinB
MNQRSHALADRLEQGANALLEFAANLTEDEWHVRIPRDGRKVGVVVHHVASVYPIETGLAQSIAKGNPVVGVTNDVINDMNAGHARDNHNATKAETLDLLRRNSTEAAAAIRAFSDDDLDRAVLVSLYSDAPLTSQFVLEDHAVRHSYHHLAKIREALRTRSVVPAQGTVLANREAALR